MYYNKKKLDFHENSFDKNKENLQLLKKKELHKPLFYWFSLLLCLRKEKEMEKRIQIAKESPNTKNVKRENEWHVQNNPNLHGFAKSYLLLTKQKSFLVLT